MNEQDDGLQGSSDTEYAKGFVAGQAYGIQIIIDQLKKLIRQGQN